MNSYPLLIQHRGLWVETWQVWHYVHFWNFDLILLGRGVFWPFLEHDPKPFPFGCACPTEGYFLMGPRQAVGSGRGRAGRGRECHLRPRTTLAPSRRPRRAHLHFFPSRPPPPPLQSPPAPTWGRLGRARAWQASRSHVDAYHPVSSLQARTGGEIGGISSSAPLPTFPCFAISTFVQLFLLFHPRHVSIVYTLIQKETVGPNMFCETK